MVPVLLREVASTGVLRIVLVYRIQHTHTVVLSSCQYQFTNEAGEHIFMLCMDRTTTTMTYSIGLYYVFQYGPTVCAYEMRNVFPMAPITGTVSRTVHVCHTP